MRGMEYSKYKNVFCCVSCDWYDNPMPANGPVMIKPPCIICPKCGSDLKKVTGRYITGKVKTLFGGRTVITGMQRKSGTDNKAPNKQPIPKTVEACLEIMARDAVTIEDQDKAITALNVRLNKLEQKLLKRQ